MTWSPPKASPAEKTATVRHPRRPMWRIPKPCLSETSRSVRHPRRLMWKTLKPCLSGTSHHVRRYPGRPLVWNALMASPGPDKRARLVPLRAGCAARVGRQQILRVSGTCWAVACSPEGGTRVGGRPDSISPFRRAISTRLHRSIRKTDAMEPRRDCA